MSKLDQKTWDEIEIALLGGQSANSLAKQYGITEGAIRYRFKHKKAALVEHAVVKVVEARQAVAALPESLRVQVDTLAETRLQIIEMTARSAELAAKTAYRMTHIANLQSAKLDEENPDKETARMVHGLMETANKAAMQPLELLKASKGVESPKDDAPTGLEHFYGQDE